MSLLFRVLKYGNLGAYLVCDTEENFYGKSAALQLGHRVFFAVSRCCSNGRFLLLESSIAAVLDLCLGVRHCGRPAKGLHKAI